MALVRVAAVESVDARVLGVVFTDGLVRELDFASCNAGVFAALDDDTFAAVSVDPVAGTISFPGGIDFDRDVLHGDAPAASRHQPVLIRQYRLEH
ncbi:MAG: DUF2442 domain-containing protein [Acidimicrobiales bacterium]